MHIRVIKNFWSQFCFLSAGAVKKTVINDEDIFPAIICQTFDVIVYDICSKKRSKTEPVCFCGIKETVKRVLGKLFLKRASPSLHIHTSSDKNVAEFAPHEENYSTSLITLHYTKRNRFMPFLLAEILNFQGSTHRYGVGSFSYKFVILYMYSFC